jgi:hypothetical protein
MSKIVGATRNEILSILNKQETSIIWLIKDQKYYNENKNKNNYLNWFLEHLNAFPNFCRFINTKGTSFVRQC